MCNNYVKVYPINISFKGGGGGERARESMTFIVQRITRFHVETCRYNGCFLFNIKNLVIFRKYRRRWTKAWKQNFNIEYNIKKNI